MPEQTTTDLPDQPDGIEDDSRDLPTPTVAAERVGDYIRASGDGLYDVQDGAPLYARDLEALTRVPTKLAATQEELARTTHTLDQCRQELDTTRAEADRAIADLTFARKEAKSIYNTCKQIERDRDQLRYERRLLGAARLVLEEAANSGVKAPSVMAGIRKRAADMAQRIVDEIGHPVTDEPALGPSFRAQLAEAEQTIEAKAADVAHLRQQVVAVVAQRDHLAAELATLKRHASHLFAGVDAAYRFANRLDADCCGTYAQQLRDAIGKAGTAPVPGSSRRAQEAGDRVEDGGMMGTLVRCEMCGGSGLLHQPDELPETAAPAPEPNEPADDELAADIDRAEEAAEAEAPAHAQGYAEAVARLRDDDRYRNWWTAAPGRPSYAVYWDGPGRRHLADYLETVGPDGVDVETGRWPAREQAVIRAAIAWRKRIVGHPNLWADDQDFALIAAVDALPHAGGTEPAGEPQASEPAAPKLAQGGIIRRGQAVIVGEQTDCGHRVGPVAGCAGWRCTR